jgi:adenylate kinase
MNKQSMELKRKNKLFFIGSARGVNRFYITNEFIKAYPKAKVINTGVLIHKLAKSLDFGNLGSISIDDYCRYLEPVFVQSILNHLEHGDVILDTHFYHKMPCISIRGLREFMGRISAAIIVLVDADPMNIYKEKRGGEDKWFEVLEDVKYDVFSNKECFEFYVQFFSKYISQKNISLDLEEIEKEKLSKFLGKLKNEN